MGKGCWCYSAVGKRDRLTLFSQGNFSLPSYLLCNFWRDFFRPDRHEKGPKSTGKKQNQMLQNGVLSLGWNLPGIRIGLPGGKRPISSYFRVCEVKTSEPKMADLKSQREKRPDENVQKIGPNVLLAFHERISWRIVSRSIDETDCHLLREKLYLFLFISN